MMISPPQRVSSLSYSEYVTNQDDWQNPANTINSGFTDKDGVYHGYTGYSDSYFGEYDREDYSTTAFKDPEYASDYKNNSTYYYNHAIISTGKANGSTMTNNDGEGINKTPSDNSFNKYIYQTVCKQRYLCYLPLDKYIY